MYFYVNDVVMQLRKPAHYVDRKIFLWYSFMAPSLKHTIAAHQINQASHYIFNPTMDI